MRRIATTGLPIMLLWFFVLVEPSGAQTKPISIEFNGTTYVLGNAVRDEKGGLSEFAPTGESIKAWTTLITFHHFPNRKASAQQTAQQLMRNLKRAGRGSNHDLILVKGTREAYLAYVAADSPADPAPEFSIYKFGPDDGGGGVVILQISEKMRAGDRTPAVIDQKQKYWMQRLFSLNLDVVRKWFADVLPPK